MKDEYKKGGLKVKINNKTSKEDILNYLAFILTSIEKNFEIEEFSNINIYICSYIRMMKDKF